MICFLDQQQTSFGLLGVQPGFPFDDDDGGKDDNCDHGHQPKRHNAYIHGPAGAGNMPLLAVLTAWEPRR